MAVVLVAAACLAYGGTLSVPSLYDDAASILHNLTLRHLGTAFFPPPSTTVNGRPVLNLSFAINYALGGTGLGGYHATNLAIHALAGLTLFGIARRTLVARAGLAAGSRLAFCTALLWIVHPLQTESVTYVVQRSESLMGLFYLLTLYYFIRGAEARGRRIWFGLSLAACLLGMATKEVMVSAPLIVLLYDRTFLAGSVREAGRRRWRFYALLAATWLLLIPLTLSSHGRSGSAGFGSGVPWWNYAITQLRAVVQYLRLCFWPSPLIFDYGRTLDHGSLRTVPDALIIAGLIAAAGWALIKRPALGFPGVCFFVILAPSSSIVPIATETMAEHRIYLPLACVVALGVTAIFQWMGRAALPICSALALLLLSATWQRNRTYRSEESIWTDTVSKRPGNERAQYNLGCVLAVLPGRAHEAIARFREAVRLKPDYVEAHYNLARTLQTLPGGLAEAIAEYGEALRLEPDLAAVHCNLGCALAAIPGRLNDAIAQFEEAVRLKDDSAEAHFDLGNALYTAGRWPEAIAEYRDVLRLEPTNRAARQILEQIRP